MGNINTLVGFLLFGKVGDGGKYMIPLVGFIDILLGFYGTCPHKYNLV